MSFHRFDILGFPKKGYFCKRTVMVFIKLQGYVNCPLVLHWRSTTVRPVPCTTLYVPKAHLLWAWLLFFSLFSHLPLSPSLSLLRVCLSFWLETAGSCHKGEERKKTSPNEATNQISVSFSVLLVLSHLFMHQQMAVFSVLHPEPSSNEHQLLVDVSFSSSVN